MWEYLTPDTIAQIWAEAKERVAQGEPLYLDAEIEKYAEEVQSRHFESDAWEEDILTFISDKAEVTTKEVWELAVQGDRPISRMDQNRIAKIMRVNGWEYKLVSKKGIKVKLWVKG